MLFNSPEFLLLFLPVALAGHALLMPRSAEAGVWWLVACSLAFYGAWDVTFLPVIVTSLLGNFALSRIMERCAGRAWRRALIGLGLIANLGALGVYKYSGFLAASINAATAAGLPVPEIVLPVGISFFTFQQIAFLVDSYRGTAIERSFSRYLLFITFFPQLIAGPIVHHREMMPQFAGTRGLRADDIAAGLTMLAIGLVKKIVIADTVATPASAVFASTAAGLDPAFTEAWLAALLYALQIYFDFSAYSDMAIGLGRMFGINLPINFASPYKATSIADFWRRWHITLSRFLRDYLYVPLGGNRRGLWRQRANLIATMALGGLWHGAGWTFLLWGALHGVYLLVNHAWSRTALAGRLGANVLWRHAAHALTLIAVIVAWVPFRAADLPTTLAMWRGMAGFNGIVPPARGTEGLPSTGVLGALESVSLETAVLAAALLAAVLLLPNAGEIMRAARLGTPSRGYPATVIATDAPRPWRPTYATGGLLAAALALVILKINDVSEFIYFQF